MSGEFFYFEAGEECRRVVQQDGVRTTIALNKFEIIVAPGNDLWEQQVVQSLREWVRWRKSQEELRESGDLPEPRVP